MMLRPYFVAESAAMASIPPGIVENGAECTPRTILSNPGFLKLELMRRGIRVEQDCLDPAAFAPQGSRASTGGLSAHARNMFGNATDVDLILPEGTWVTAPLSNHFTHTSPYLLRRNDSGCWLHWDPPFGQQAEVIPPVCVQVVPPAAFYTRTTSTGLPLARLGTVHGSYLALSPIAQCSFVGTDDQCHFCSLTTKATDELVAVDDILEAIRIVRDTTKIDMVYLSVGHLSGSDGGVRALEPYIRAIKKHFDILVAMDALPPEHNAWIDRTYAMGVDSLSYNLEIFDPRRFDQICPGPSRRIGRQRFLDALEYAATVLPAGAVICHLIVGLESPESTCNGIDALLTRKVMPVLPIFRPFRGRDMRETDEAIELETQQIFDLYGYLYKKVRQHKLPMSWVQNISVVTTPAEGRFFVGAKRPGLLQRLVGGERRPSVMLSDWRRALRVKEVDDSLKSSGL